MKAPSSSLYAPNSTMVGRNWGSTSSFGFFILQIKLVFPVIPSPTMTTCQKILQISRSDWRKWSFYLLSLFYFHVCAAELPLSPTDPYQHPTVECHSAPTAEPAQFSNLDAWWMLSVLLNRTWTNWCILKAVYRIPTVIDNWCVSVVCDHTLTKWRPPTNKL